MFLPLTLLALWLILRLSVTGDTRQYEYARNVQGTMESRYLISGGSSQGPAIAPDKPKLPPSSDDPSGPPPPKKSKSEQMIHIDVVLRCVDIDTPHRCATSAGRTYYCV